ncbi:MAG: hypothetical protein M3167_14685 [Acidobacteriota bacterium]|nr:hypothetical protein [Acidobacteriota bacterium]
MRAFRTGFLLAVAALFSARSAAAQESPEARFFREVGDYFTAYQKDASARFIAHQKEVRVLRLLGEAAESLGGMQAGLVGAKAREKLSEARQAAEADPPSEDPVPAVLDAFTRALESAGIGDNPNQMRGRAFASLLNLEDDVLRKAALFDQEARNLRNLSDALYRRSQFFTEGAANAVETSGRVRRRALR